MPEPTVIANLRHNLAQPPAAEYEVVSMERAGFQALLDAYDAERAIADELAIELTRAIGTDDLPRAEWAIARHRAARTP